eukprot:5699747-Amphidinium_carterae.1
MLERIWYCVSGLLGASSVDNYEITMVGVLHSRSASQQHTGECFGPQPELVRHELPFNRNIPGTDDASAEFGPPRRHRRKRRDWVVGNNENHSGTVAYTRHAVRRFAI